MMECRFRESLRELQKVPAEDGFFGDQEKARFIASVAEMVLFQMPEGYSVGKDGKAIRSR
jgi:hypothetical protein